MKMKFIKKANILQILILIIVLSSCTKEKKKTELSDAQLPKSTLPKMKPLINDLPKLTAEYIDTKKRAVDAFYNKNWSNNSANGSFLVAKNGQIIYEKYEGYSNFRNKTLITKSTPLHIASVSKVITATAILKLVNAKRIDLDQKVNTILKEFPYPDVTIKTLLNHRSGMRNYAYFTDRDKLIWDRHNILTNQDILTIMATKDIGLEFKTDTRFSYCNTNYAMLALIIEKVTKLPYKDAMKQIIFEPLGMKNTYVFDYERDKDTAVTSYKGNKVEIGKDYLDAVYGDKNIYSTPRDLLKFDRARNSSSFLTPKLQSQVYKGYSNERKGTKNYGLGIRMVNWDTGQNFYFHNGWWHGNTSSYITLRKESVTIIALSNKFTRKTYDVRKLAVLFGDYPFRIKDE
ncbi:MULTISPECIES: serine hydrolase domain-containing protein [Flavobacterium]|uniref:Beta-lactamase family protein n=1 Tax=Flavobacterium gawalongense TaxID=2594432 RepID=A0A553BSR1_9FLAO|nr:serine hydrolase domain-containing protein [Flavobacterium gawalongense]TRX03687.1 beta-lactamase family protein [Flavobacterium gawalongense]TRX08834.1 beta-lactamase family protein [Flavobacterium gawalongense]TRX11287.1 beta-lactamase family protein [Flavobacterium gawalongense]TRX12252.1 beta-lactamase family protein [Flavobacterium gawalongense]TRX30209.1 beta-lactamase family protein [Flavobacterium gawalongense]